MEAGKDDKYYKRKEEEMKQRRSSIYAAIFSLLLPGLGQYFNNEILKGLICLVAFIAVSIFYELFGFLVNIAAAIEAYITNRKITASGYESEHFLKSIIILIILFTIGFLWGLFTFYYLKAER